MIDINVLREMVADNIQGTKEYGEYLQVIIEPDLTPVGRQECEKLRFFNLGYQFAMESIHRLLTE